MALLPVAVLVSACDGDAPDLNRLYAPFRAEAPVPLILVPGVMGSRLTSASTDREIWPGGFLTLLTGRRLGSLALPVDGETVRENRDDLQPSGLFLEAAGKQFYRNIAETLAGPGGYSCAPADDVGPETNCFLFAWDWRRDLSEAAAGLDALIERIRRERDDPDLRVDIVAHSAGALVTRYFIRFGGRDVLDQQAPQVTEEGAAKVRKAILIAAPNFGSIEALQRAIMGSPVGPIATIRPEILATFPSLYELLPHPDRSWMIGVHGERIDRDLYDIETWRSSRWSIFAPRVRARIRGRFGTAEQAEEYVAHLERFMERALARGERFQRALSIPVKSSRTQYIVFGGSCVLTPAHCAMETVGGEVKIRLRPENIVNQVPGVDYHSLMLEPGDGSVTKASLLARNTLDPAAAGGFFPLDYVVFICRGHAELPGDITFRDNLLNILLY